MAETKSRMSGIEQDEKLERAKMELAAVKQDLALLRSDMKALLGSINGGEGGRINNAKARLMETTQQARQEARERILHAYKTLRDRGADTYSNLRDRGRAAYLTARARGNEAAEKSRARIEEHPLTAVLAALGAGLIIGKLMKRR